MTNEESVPDGCRRNHQGGQVELAAYSGFTDAGLSRQEWDTFVERSGGDIFLTFDWCEVWWKHYGRGKRLKVLVFRKNSNLVGVLPLFVDRVVLGPFVVKVVKLVGVDYALHAYCLPIAVEEIRQVADRFLEYMESQAWWDLIFLGPISGIYKHTAAVSEAFRTILRPGVDLRVAVSSATQSVIDGLLSWEDYIQDLGPHTRRNIRHAYKLLMNRGEQVESSLCLERDVDSQFGRFVAMHQQRWESVGMAGHFRSWPGSFGFHSELARAQAKRGRLRLMEVLAGDEVIGFDYSYAMGSVQWDLLNARVTIDVLKGLDVGKVIWCEVLKSAIQQGVHTIDYLRGSQEYKKSLGTRDLPITNLYFSRTSLLSKASVKLLFLCSKLSRVLYYRLWRNRISPFLRIRQRTLTDLWIRTHWFGEGSV